MPKYQNANSYWIEQQAKGKVFVDVGCMWGVTGDYSFLAESSGATKVAGIDIYPAQPEFEAKRKARNSQVAFVQGDINDAGTITRTLDALGGEKADLVFCSGVLYHVPDPVFTLRQLGRLLKPDGQLILNTMTIPEQGLPCTAVFFGGLGAADREKVRLNRRGVGLDAPFDAAQGYANWVWGMAPSCVRSILNLAGFEIVDEDVGVHEEVFAALSRRRPELEFRDESGAWSGDQGAKVFGTARKLDPAAPHPSSVGATLLSEVMQRMPTVVQNEAARLVGRAKKVRARIFPR